MHIELATHMLISQTLSHVVLMPRSSHSSHIALPCTLSSFFTPTFCPPLLTLPDFLHVTMGMQVVWLCHTPTEVCAQYSVYPADLLQSIGWHYWVLGADKSTSCWTSWVVLTWYVSHCCTSTCHGFRGLYHETRVHHVRCLGLVALAC